MITLGQRIRELREEKDISLRELAKRVEKSAAFLSDIELGRRYPSDEVLSNMAQVLGTSVKDLRSYDTRPPIEDIRRLANSDPEYALAFRTVIDRKISPKELKKFAEGKFRRNKKS